MNTTFYAEYDNYGLSRFELFLHSLRRITSYNIDYPGPGSNTSERVSDHILNSTEAEEFTIDKVFREHPKWIDYSYAP